MRNRSTGHVDFYFNGGIRQSGCIVNFGKVFKYLAIMKWGKALTGGKDYLNF